MKAINKMGLMAAGVAMMTVCHANVVSWNYNNNSDAYATQSSDVAGVSSATYWNDSFLDGRTIDLLDNTGAASTIDIASLNSPGWGGWSITGSHPGTDTDGSHNKEVLNGYQNGTTGAGGSGITLSGISGTYAGTYDIIVYFSSDVAGRTGAVTDGTTTYLFNTMGAASVTDASGNAVFAQTLNTIDNATVANYAVFSGLTGDTQTLTVNVDSGGGLAAIQIIPEPATMGLVGVFGTGILFIRRRFLI